MYVLKPSVRARLVGLLFEQALECMPEGADAAVWLAAYLLGATDLTNERQEEILALIARGPR